MPQAVILQQSLVALGERSIALGTRHHKQRLQYVDYRATIWMRMSDKQDEKSPGSPRLKDCR